MVFTAASPREKYGINAFDRPFLTTPHENKRSTTKVKVSPE